MAPPGMELPSPQVRIGTAAWAIPRAVWDRFPGSGSSLRRYSNQFCAAEINTTFYRRHRPSTYERWLNETPPGFKFAFKAPKAITHTARLDVTIDAVRTFVEDARRFGDKLGPILVQLPPSLPFHPEVADRFFRRLREGHGGQVACEPRHPSWFAPPADALLSRHHVARVGADPSCSLLGGQPGGWTGLAYWRLHGSPRVYYSSYDDVRLAELASALRASPADTWCIFDNTASGAATADALRLQQLLHSAAETRHGLLKGG